MVRSTMAHATIAGVDTSAAAEMPGVHAVYTGSELADMGLWAAPLPCAWPVTPDMVNPPHYPAATTEVHHVGEIIAVVLADSRYRAADAAETVVVDYEPLPAVASIDDAVADAELTRTPTSARTRPTTGRSSPSPEAVDAAFADATHHVTADFVQQRLIPVAMEPRGVLAIPSPTGATSRSTAPPRCRTS